MADTYALVPANKAKERKLVYRPWKEKNGPDRYVSDKHLITKSGDEDLALHCINKLESVIEKVRVVQEINAKNFKPTLTRNHFLEINLVISTAKEVSHPAFKYHYIARSCMFFNSVANIVLATNSSDDKVDVHLMKTNTKMARFIDVQTGTMPFDKDREYIEQYVALPPTEMKYITVLERRTSGDMSMMDNFVGDTLRAHFIFTQEQEWTKI